jgi:hypothetical protein
VPLPSKLLRFDTELKQGIVVSNSQFSNAADIRSISLQRAADRNHYETVNTLFTADYPVGSDHFRLNDITALSGSVIYYRILVTENSGYSYYSPVNLVHTGLTAQQRLLVYPNPVTDGNLNIRLEETAMIFIYDNTGKLLLRKQGMAGTQVLNLGHFAKGIYLLKTGNTTSKVIIQ